MKFSPIRDPKEINRLMRKSRHGHIRELLYEFRESDYQIARVDYDPGDYVSPYSCASSFQKAISTEKMPIRAMTKDGKVYLVKILIDVPEKD